MTTSPAPARCPRCGRPSAGRPCPCVASSPGPLAADSAQTRIAPAPFAPPPAPPRPPPSSSGSLAPALPEPPEAAEARTDPRRRLGRYLLLEELGRGGMGVVYRAWDEQLRRLVAVKMLTDASPEALERFGREAQIVAALRHPNIVGVFESGQVGGRHFLVMDHIDGDTLERRLSGTGRGGERGARRLPLVRALEVIRDVALAVHHAHERGVVHRDLKPQNIMLDAEDHPWVLDFGLAKMRGSSRQTRTGVVVGTPAYMAPEQVEAAGGPADVDGRTDVYALGATLYHVLTGGPPFQGETDLNVMMAVVARDPVPPARRNPRAIGDLETICLRCLEKDPERRYPSPRELAEDIDRHLAGDPIMARPIGRSERLRRWIRRRRALVVLAALLAIAVAAGGGLFVQSRVERARAAAALEAERLAREEESRRERAAQERASAEALERQRAEQLDGLEADATARTDAFRTARDELLVDEATAKVLVAESDERVRAVLFTGWEALFAHRRAVDALDGDPARAAVAASVAVELTELAVATRQFAAARNALVRAGELGIDAATAESLDAKVVRAEEAFERHRDSRIDRTIRKALSGDFSKWKRERIPDGVDALVALAGDDVVDRLCTELDERTERLRSVVRAEYLGANTLTAEERTSGATEIAGLADAVEAWLTPPPDEGWPAAEHRATIRAAERRLDARNGGPGAFRRRLREAQRAVLEPGEIDLIRLACEAFERMPLYHYRAGPSLARYLFAETDERRAIWGTLALCKMIDSPSAERWVRRMRERHARESAFARRVRERHGLMHVAKGSRVTAAIEKLLRLEPRSLEEIVSQAGVAAGTNNPQLAARRLDEAIRRSPDDPEIRFARASLLAVYRQPGPAREEIDRVRRLAPDHVEALLLSARLHIAASELRHARENLDRAIVLDPERVLALTLRAGVRRAAGDLEGARADADAATAVDPTEASAWLERGLIRHASGDLLGAFLDLTAAVELAPTDPGPFWVRASLRLGADDPDGAIEDASMVIELDPRRIDAWSLRASLHERAGRLHDAVSDWTRATDVATDRRNRGLVRGWRPGRFDADMARVRGRIRATGLAAPAEAEPDATEGRDADPDTLIARAITRARGGDPDGALAELDGVVGRWPGPRTFLVRGQLRLATGDLEGATDDFTWAIEHDERIAESWYLRGITRRRAGDPSAAKTDLVRCLELEPSDELRGKARAALDDLDGD